MEEDREPSPVNFEDRLNIKKKLSRAGNSLTKVKQSIFFNTTLPSDCDIVIQFPKIASKYVVEWLCDLIRSSNSGIELKICRHEATGFTYILCSCTFQSLIHSAEELHLKKRLKNDYGGQLKEFFVDDAMFYDGISESKTFFTTQERQQMTLHCLNNIRVTQQQKIHGNLFRKGQAIVPRLLSTGLVKQIFPIHSISDLDNLRRTWVFEFVSKQPLDAVKDYFGVRIGMYFAFLGYYTTLLALPAFAGMLIWYWSGTSQDFDDFAFVAFALINVIWSTVFIETWKRREAEQAYRWGTLDKQDDLITEPRPLYTGELRESLVTGRLEPHFPKWKRNLFFYCISIPVMTICHCFILLVCFNFFSLYDAINDKIVKGELYSIFRPIPNLFLAVAVMIMDKVYGQIAVWLNDKENYRSEEEYKNQLIIKLMVFQSVNSFLSLFYTAFYIQDFDRLKGQLATLFIVRQVVGNMKESLLSFFMAKVNQHLGASGLSGADLLKKLRQECVKPLQKSPDSPNNSNKSDEDVDGGCSEESPNKCGTQLTQAEAEGLLPKYDGTFEDYLEMVIQFSYVTWFSSVFPLAGLFALLNNFVEIRSDAFKLCMAYQRPIGEQVRNIGAWQTVLEITSIGTIIVNTALIGISGPMQRMFPGLDNFQRLLLIVVLEHIVLAIKFFIRMAINDVPEWVSIETAKLEFSRREALRCKLQEHVFDMKSSKGLHNQLGFSTDTEPDYKDVECDVTLECQSGVSSARNSPKRDLSSSHRPFQKCNSPLSANMSFDNSEPLGSDSEDDVLRAEVTTLT